MNRYASLGIAVVLLTIACDEPFMRDVRSRRQPNDLASCAPDAGIDELIAEVVEDWVALRWTTSATDNDGVLIERRTQDSIHWGEVAIVTVGSNSYDDFGALPNRRYVYRAMTYRVAGSGMCASAPSNEVIVTTVPAAVDGLELSAISATTIELSWTDSNDYISGFRIDRQLDGEGFGELVSLPATNRQFRDETVNPAAVTDYRVSAFNASGGSAPTEIRYQVISKPTLAWGTDPWVDPECTLYVPGVATYDPGALYAGATGSITANGSTSEAEADEGGIWGELPDLTPGTVSTSWTVIDTNGGQQTIGRDLDLHSDPVSRLVTRRPRRDLNDDGGEGRQALRPDCSDCPGLRGGIGVGGRTSCALSQDGQVFCWGWNDYGETGRGHRWETRPWAGRVCGDRTCAQDLIGLDLDVGIDSSHTCVRTAAGEVWCWGWNTDGQLGDGSSENRGIVRPVCLRGSGDQCERLVGARQVVLGYDSTCVRMNDGTAWCWGSDDSGELGNGPGTPEEEWHPTQVCLTGIWDPGTFQCTGEALTGIRSLTAGRRFYCALLEDTSAVCWGYNYAGQLGDGTYQTSENPVQVGGGTPLTGIVQLAAGDGHTCAVLDDDTASCWGDNEHGQLGTGTTEYSPLPMPVCAPGAGACEVWQGVAQVSAGLEMTCAVTTSHGAYCWGRGWAGRLGNGLSTGEQLKPGPVCAEGQAGTCTPLTGVRRVDAGLPGACAIMLADNALLCWGNNGYAQLGNGTTEPALNPMPTCLGQSCEPLSNIALAGLGEAHGCALEAESGRVLCWGEAASGRLGDGVNQAQEPLPVRTNVPGELHQTLGNLRALSVGASHSCALDADGSAWCWGTNTNGEIGSNTMDWSFGLATQVCASGSGADCVPLTGLTAIAAGGGRHGYPSFVQRYSHTCAVTGEGRVLCWGDNRNGQIGDGSRLSDNTSCSSGLECGFYSDCFDGICIPEPYGQRTPAEVSCGVPPDCDGNSPLQGAISVAAGQRHSCALLEDGSVKCWGGNAEGQIGDSSALDRLKPVRIPITDAVAVVAGGFHTCVLLAEGTARCWGDNLYGQIGDGTSVRTRSSPQTVCRSGAGSGCPPLTGIAALAAGFLYSCALLADGTVRCWGDNEVGQLGIGNWDHQNLPRPVCAAPADGSFPCTNLSEVDCTAGPWLENVVAIDAGMGHTCALLDDQTVTCWGHNVQANLGVGLGRDDLFSSCMPHSGVCLAGHGPCDRSGVWQDAARQICQVVSVSVP